MKKDEEVKKAMPSDHSMDLPKKDKAKTAWMIIAIVALVVLIGLGIYGYMQMQKTNQKIKDQQAQIDELNDAKKTLEDTAAAAAKAATDAAAKAVTSAATSSDADQVSQLAKNQSEASVGTVVGKNVNLGVPRISDDKKFAVLGISGIADGQSGPGAGMYFKKVNGSWVYLGTIQNMTPEFRERYGIPAGI